MSNRLLAALLGFVLLVILVATVASLGPEPQFFEFRSGMPAPTAPH